jgi:predicted dehydrogenase
MSKRAVFIGTGAIAREHLFAMQFIDGVSAEAVCDLSPARAESSAERFQVPKWFTNSNEMLDATRPDFVHITTPPQSHFDLTRNCLERGLNVICEKPITSSYVQFQTLRSIAEAKGLLLIENQNFRTMSSIKTILGDVERGDLGEIVEVQVQVHLDVNAPDSPFNDRNVPHFTATMRGGPAGDFITHMTYIAQMFVGGDTSVATVWKQFSDQNPKRDDEFRALLKGKTAVAYLSFSGNAKPNGFWLKVIGTKGQAEANLFEPPRIAYRRLRAGAPPLATLADGFAEARRIATGSIGGLYRKFSGKARYDGLEEFLGDCYAALGDRSKVPVSLGQIDDSSRTIDKLLSDEFRI